MATRAFRSGLLVLLLLLAPLVALSAPRCGGTERWAVKVAADDGAAQIDTSAVADMTVKQLNQIPEPDDLPKDEATRHRAEMRVVRVTGRLVLFKDETDKDYHLIITDDSRKYTKGGTKTKATGTSLIAEIPHPDCVAGQKLPRNTRSHFENQLAEVRNGFDDSRAASIGAENDMDLPVRITGLVFFDRPHGQTGRARNNIEIHPILSIEFLDEQIASVDQPAERIEVAGARVRRDLIEGGEFEERIDAWKISDPDVIRVKAYPDADQVRGRGRAQLGGFGIKSQNWMYQTVSIPRDALNVQLRFRMRIKTDEVEDEKRILDTMRVQLRTPQGQVIKPLFTFSNLDASRKWKAYSADLTPYRGRTVQLAFTGREDRGLVTFFWVDAVKVLVDP